MQRSAFLILSFLSVYAFCWPYDEPLAKYNLNENKTAAGPIDYWGAWPDHEYHPSPDNWRLPTYTIFLDRISNGDPTNDDINGTAFEHVINSNQMRHGGDLEGLIDTLDYIEGMGFKVIYFAGTYLMNLPWAYDGYSPVDTTLLDMHYGTLEDWRRTVDEIHKRNMYVLMDNTLATLSNLIGFKGHLNDSADFTPSEYEVQWVTDREYADFKFGNEWNETCNYPKFWDETGFPLTNEGVEELNGCYNSDFDQYGELEAFGNFPDWQRQLTKFASVQDRLREWHKPVRDVIVQHSCLQIASLDIDGFRFDKAVQSTLEPLSQMLPVYRECAQKLGKKNFFLPGEITSGDSFGSLYLGRGRQPDQRVGNAGEGVKLTNTSEGAFLREDGLQALDASAFHYTIYRSMTRFLGLDGNLVAGFDLPTDFIEAWNEMLITNDFLNAFTGEIDPRHMYGVSNQDNFRWPALQNGTDKYLLGLYIISLELPGIPLILWGEEQDMYVFDATAANYMFGRQPMTYQTAWWTQGCFNLNTEKFYDFPIDKGRNGCNDITVTYDQRNPAHPLRNIMKRMFEIRAHFPVAQDGLFLETISQLTEDIYLPGSSTTPTVTGLWSVLRSYFPGVQTNAILANETLWLVYQNGNSTKTYGGNCTSVNGSLLAPFDSGTKLKNLFYPYDELTLEDGPKSSKNTYGCVRKMELLPWEYRAYVKASEFIEPGPTVTDFFPGHDARLLSSEDTGETMPIQLGYSTEMDCDSITKAFYLNSTTEKNITAELDKSSVNCTKISARTTSHAYTGEIPTVWTWSAKLKNVHHGIHQLTVKNVSSSGVYTNSTDKFLLRLGAHDNPLISPLANYSSTLVHKSNDDLYLQHRAAGADMFRYSSDFGRSWNEWATYKGGNTSITIPGFTGTDSQKWEGTHIRVQYFSRLTGSSDYIQEGDYGSDRVRRFPHLWFNGPYNQYGYDAGMDSKMKYDSKTSRWTYDFVYEWPAIGQLNVWGSDSEGNPDTSEVYGDVGNSSSVQKLPPSYLSSNVINITTLPPFPHLGWTISLDDGNLRYELIPVGSGWAQLVLFILLWVVPILMGLAGVFIFIGNFYRVKLNMNGNVTKADKFPVLFWRRIKGTFTKDDDFEEIDMADKGVPGNMALAAAGASDQRRTVLIATMEYDIQDWKVKVKIGGLGVMAQLMSQNLKHQNLIWVVPCVGDIDYPEDTPAEPFVVTILDHPYSVQVQYHQVENITYVLLDAPVFRQQTKAEPYPPRMDDLDSAIYYSAWNQCIAEVIKRTPSIDLYHINDFHGCVAPLYLLPSRTIPVCLSLHNAEFQGLWALRTPQEKKEVCSVFNIPVEIATKYCQFGNVFNLLHTGASYLRFHQRGFGAVGVSEKYGKRSWARYPIFWSLAKIGSLPNPDPSDTAALKKDPDVEVTVQTADESANDKLQAQKWAGLNEDPNADLLVFVGRWSKQKGVDLIADVMPAVLSARPNVQLICIGPLIDLYGKLAAIKLERIMEMFPGRVFSKPEFTILPPFVFSGADFALIPSRDEPFGLIAVEFGRKGALGIGSRIGGLGQMPGWWYTVESDSARHLLHQLRTAIKSALDSSLETRQEMRANSAKQRFPVLEWVQKLEVLQRTSIHIHHQKNQLTVAGSARESQIYWETPGLRDSGMITRPSSHLSLPGTLDANRTSTSQPAQPSLLQLQAVEAQEMQAAENNRGSALNRNLSLGRRSGPGHGRKRLTKKSPRESQMLEPIDGDTTDDESFVTPQENMITQEEAMAAVNLPLQDIATHPRNNSHSRGESDSSASESSRFLSRDSSPVRVARDLSDPTAPYALESRNISVLSLPSVVNDHDQPNFHLQKVDPTFTDSMGHFTRNFETMLANLNKKNSISDYCIELYLMKSERKFFYMYNDAQLKKQPKERPVTGAGLDQTAENTPYNLVTEGHEDSDANNTDEIDQWLARLGYKRPIAVQRFMRWRVGNWPVYALFLGLGQIIATNSAQITLLAGQIGETAVKLYVIAAIYCVSSIVWWCLFFRFPSVIVLTLPWFIYSMAFVTMGVSPFALSEVGQAWAQNVAAGVYAAASSSGSLFFALNFGDQGAVPVKDWMFRASLIQGISQLYTVALWYWSSKVTAAEVGGVSTVALNSWKLTAVVMPIAAVCFIIGVLLALGLPKYYRQAPGKILFFYTSLFRRRIVLWFFFMVIIQNWFLSAAFGRNWSFLWSSQHTKPWEVALLVLFFFVVLWVGVMLLFRFLSKEHSWILPVFGLSIGAPRWAQTWWGTSNIGYYLPWAGGLTSGAIASRCLWLWLGVLDEIQQVGLGMILLQTLTRVHVVFVLLAAQALGSIATICARGFAPNKVGPGDISPAVGSSLDAVGNAWFWIALFFQLLASFGFLLFYRREQLNRP